MSELESQEKFVYPTFHGDGGSYFRIWIVNTLLTIITFGIYGAWAKIRTIKYFNNSTELMGARFDFHGDPVAILKGRVIMFVLAIIYFSLTKFHMLLAVVGSILIFVIFPWVFIKSLRFKLNNTSYRNIRFSFRGQIKRGYEIYFKYMTFFLAISVFQSLALYFVGYDPQAKASESTTVLWIIGVSLVINFIAFLILLPKFYHTLLGYIYDNTYFGNTKVSFNSLYNDFRSQVFFKILFSYVGFFAAFGIVAFIVTLLKTIVGGAAVTIIFMVGLTLLAALMTCTIINYIWNHLSFGDYRSNSKLVPTKLFEISFVNALLTICTFGLFFPWAKIRQRRYIIENKGLNVDDFDQFSSDIDEQNSAIGEEISDALDFDFEIGI